MCLLPVINRKSVLCKTCSVPVADLVKKLSVCPIFYFKGGTTKFYGLSLSAHCFYKLFSKDNFDMEDNSF